MGQTDFDTVNAHSYLIDGQPVAALPGELASFLAAVPLAAAADIPASTNITAVPGSFAALTDVQSYLAGPNMVPNIESRLDNLEAKVNTILARLRSAGIIS